MPGILKTIGQNKAHPKPIKVQALSQNALFDWARFWGPSNRLSVLEFLSSLRSAP